MLPVVVKMFERPDASQALRRSAIITIGNLSRKVSFCDHASRVIHPLVRVLPTGPTEIRNAVMETLSALVVQLGPSYAIFIPVVNKVLVQNRIQHPGYDSSSPSCSTASVSRRICLPLTMRSEARWTNRHKLRLTR